MNTDFRQKKDGRYIIHIYRVVRLGQKVSAYFYDDLILCKAFARLEFKKPDVYKVKIWDQTKGDIEPNKHKAKALVFELV